MSHHQRVETVGEWLIDTAHGPESPSLEMKKRGACGRHRSSHTQTSLTLEKKFWLDSQRSWEHKRARSLSPSTYIKVGQHCNSCKFKVRTVAWVIVVGDGFCNVVDGLTSAASFSVSISKVTQTKKDKRSKLTHSDLLPWLAIIRILIKHRI